MKKPVASVDLIIKRKDKILLGKVSDKWNNNGKYEWGLPGRYEWGLPGREIEFGDDFEKTAEKNLKEELGMKLKSFEVISVNNNFGFGNHYIAIGILVEAEGEPKITKPGDWKEWKWFDKDKVPDKLFPSAELTIKSFLGNKVSVEM